MRTSKRNGFNGNKMVQKSAILDFFDVASSSIKTFLPIPFGINVNRSYDYIKEMCHDKMCNNIIFYL